MDADGKEYYAHKRNTPDSETVQTMYEHLINTVKCAAQCLKTVGLEKTAYLAGLLHDIGKYTDDFQKYLDDGDNGKRGSVIHTFQGCRYLMDKFHQSDELNQIMTAEYIAFAIGAHHGLFDCVDSTKRIGLKYRVEKHGISYQESVSRFLQDVSNEEVEKLFTEAANEIERKINFICENYTDEHEYAFETGLLARLILSAVIEGDRLDTAEFMNGIKQNSWPEDMTALWQDRLDFLESKIRKFSCDTSVTNARHEISEICRSFAEHEPGIFRLTVPTGGGKTLSSLRYALAHAKIFNKRRLIFTSPLLSILEQNADVIHEFVGDDEMILEHHSNVVHDSPEPDKLDERELLIQNWNAPIIITTLVQLLNTLFSGKTTSIRRFEALCDSVIVIDEVQTVPTKMLTLFNLAIRFLSECCNATIVLCSATQPDLEGTDHPLRNKPIEIVPMDETLWAAFRRTEIKAIGNRSLNELPDLIRAQMDVSGSLLVVCNKKNEAAYLLQNTKSDHYQSFHLSAAMCMQHRRDVLDAMQEALVQKRKVLCIATQVIEAGVDISFDTVIRLTAGMDSIIQAAGRCNRSGESTDLRPVYVVNCSDEKIGRLKDIQRGKDASIALLDIFQTSPEKFGNDLFSDESIRYYYKAFYKDMAEGEQDYCVYDLKTTLFDFMSENEKYADDSCMDINSFFLRQALKTAGHYFSVFDEDTTDIIVPYGAGKELIADLCSEKCKYDTVYLAKVLKQISSYTVSVYKYQRDQLDRDNALVSLFSDSVLILKEGFYDDTVGLTATIGVQEYKGV